MLLSLFSPSFVPASELYNMSAAYRVQERKTNRTTGHTYTSTDQTGGDILTRVAIPRSGSFLNTSGLARYKSRATRRPTGKCGGGGGYDPKLYHLYAHAPF